MDPDRVHAAIQEAARSFVRRDSTGYFPPILQVDSADRVLSYDPGLLPPVRIPLVVGATPLWEPIQQQLRIEGLRYALERSPIGTAPFQRQLDEADRAVLRMVVIILHDRTALGATDGVGGEGFPLGREHRAVEHELEAVSDGIRAWAGERGLSVQVAGRGVYNEFYQVAVVSNPAGGQIEVVPELVYDIAVKLGNPTQFLPWRTLGARKEDLIGWYVYRITWPALPLKTGRIHVTSAQDITLPHP